MPDTRWVAAEPIVIEAAHICWCQCQNPGMRISPCASLTQLWRAPQLFIFPLRVLDQTICLDHVKHQLDQTANAVTSSFLKKIVLQLNDANHNTSVFKLIS